jgi:excisionase family DNA binding protein
MEAEMQHVTTVRLAAMRLGVTKQRIHQLLERGELGSIRVGGTVLVNERSLERLYRERGLKKAASDAED